jgi:hypothetical protein
MFAPARSRVFARFQNALKKHSTFLHPKSNTDSKKTDQQNKEEPKESRAGIKGNPHCLHQDVRKAQYLNTQFISYSIAYCPSSSESERWVSVRRNLRIPRFKIEHFVLY